jgi:hypothetical protein
MEVYNMSVVDNPTGDRETESFPDFDLDCLLDDWESPSEVTVFSTMTDAEMRTQWITVDENHAIPLDQIR